jgi:acyl carrier protein
MRTVPRQRRGDIEGRVFALLARHSPLSPTRRRVKGNTRLDLDLGMDSMALVGLILDLEREFNLTLGVGDLVPANFATAADVVALIRAKLSRERSN